MVRELSEIRTEISSIDDQLLPLLEQRMQCSEVVDEAKMLEKYSTRVRFNILGIFQAIMDESRRIQQNEVIKTPLKMRMSIIDEQILELLARRMGYSVDVARRKMADGRPIFDSAREAEILENYSTRVGFNILGIFQAIMNESKRIQQDEVDKKPLE